MNGNRENSTTFDRDLLEEYYRAVCKDVEATRHQLQAKQAMQSAIQKQMERRETSRVR